MQSPTRQQNGQVTFPRVLPSPAPQQKRERMSLLSQFASVHSIPRAQGGQDTKESPPVPQQAPRMLPGLPMSAAPQQKQEHMCPVSQIASVHSIPRAQGGQDT